MNNEVVFYNRNIVIVSPETLKKFNLESGQSIDKNVFEQVYQYQNQVFMGNSDERDS